MASVLETLIPELVRIVPDVKEVFLRSDNAGCYHNAPLLLFLSRKGVTLVDYSFSEANSGKDVCDRKIAPLKAQIRRYLNEGEWQ